LQRLFKKNYPEKKKKKKEKKEEAHTISYNSHHNSTILVKQFRNDLHNTCVHKHINLKNV